MYCSNDSEKAIAFSEFVERYNEFLKSEGIPGKSKIEISRSIGIKGYEKKVKKVATDFRETTKMHIFGLKWKDEIDELI